MPVQGAVTFPPFVLTEVRANGRNIAVQQLPTLLDFTCCVRLHTVLHVVAMLLESCCVKFETGQTFEATTPNISFVPWSLKRSTTMLHPFAQLIQHFWGHARALRMVSMEMHNCVSQYVTCTCGIFVPNSVVIMLKVVASVCTPLPTTSNICRTNNSQQCCYYVESCCIRLHTTANSIQYLPDQQLLTMLGVVTTVCT